MAGSHNWQQFDATQTNMQNDADYAASSYRTNGVTGGIAPSATHNKMYYQWSTMSYALAQVMAALGYTILDSNEAGLETALKQAFGGLTGITAKTSGFSPAQTDKGAYFPCSGSSLTIAPAASSSLCANWFIDIANTAAPFSGVNVTIDPNGSETVNGNATLVLGPGSNGRLMSDGGNLYFRGQQIYESAQQTITTSGALTLAHGLSTVPNEVQIWLVNQTANMGYTSGQAAIVNMAGSVQNSAGSAGLNCSIIPDATNLNIRYGSASYVFLVNSPSDGHSDAITPADWKAVFRARI